jgi:hypothetical protein
MLASSKRRHENEIRNFMELALRPSYFSPPSTSTTMLTHHSDRAPRSQHRKLMARKKDYTTLEADV